MDHISHPENNMDNRFDDLSSYDGSCVYGLCFALGSNEFWGATVITIYLAQFP